MSENTEIVCLHCLKRPFKHLWKVIYTLWAILGKADEKVLEDERVLVLRNFAS